MRDDEIAVRRYLMQEQKEMHQTETLALREARERLATAQDAVATATKRERQFRPEFHAWRMIDSPGASTTVRMEVPGGWLYKFTVYADGVAGDTVMSFVPRPAGE